MDLSKPISQLFDWPSKHNVHLLLPFTILLAVSLHLAAFYAVQVVYTPAPASRPIPGAVFVAPPGSPEARALNAWVAGNDPALLAPSRQNSPHHLGLLPVQYEIRPFELELLSTEKATSREALALPSQFMPSATYLRLLPPPEPVRGQLLPTALRLGGGLETLKLQTQGKVILETNAVGVPEPGTYLIAVGPDGSVQHAILQRGSGLPELDALGIRLLFASRFSPSGQSAPLWGTLRIIWGNDIYEQAEMAPPEPQEL